MRAVVCDRLGDPSVLKIEERPIPEPGPADVLIKVGAASVNFPDVLMLSAGYQHKPELPFVPGMEGAGTIDAVGAEVKNWRAGDRVIFGVNPALPSTRAGARQPDAHARRLVRRRGRGLRRRDDRLPFAGSRAHLRKREVLLGTALGQRRLAAGCSADLGAQVIATGKTMRVRRGARQRRGLW